MPRGGRRPGAGAPKGNFNAFQGARNSARAEIVVQRMLLLDKDEQRELAYALRDAGFLVPPHNRFNKDVRGAVEFLWRRWFDSSQGKQSATASNNRTQAENGPTADSPASPATPADAKRGKTNTIKRGRRTYRRR